MHGLDLEPSERLTLNFHQTTLRLNDGREGWSCVIGTGVVGDVDDHLETGGRSRIEHGIRPRWLMNDPIAFVFNVPRMEKYPDGLRCSKWCTSTRPDRLRLRPAHTVVRLLQSDLSDAHHGG